MIRRLKTEDWFHPDGFPLTVERRDPQHPFPPHSHEFSELVIITGGHGLHETGTETWELQEGDVFVIAGPRPHHYRELRDLRLVNVMVQPGKLELGLRDLPTLPGYHMLFTLRGSWRRRTFRSRLHLSPQELGHVTGLVDELDAELKARAPGFRFMAAAAFMRIMGFLSRAYSRSRGPDDRALLRVAEALSHVERHFDQPVTIGELARIAAMSRRNFVRVFRKATGNPPVAHLIQLRLGRAAALLRDTGRRITDVAFDVGFNDSNYFARQFHKVLGVSPREYRRLHARV
jgi:AraC family L-rhamnose operon transcriptional activator RhaR/AraC family L-rhamnose operon regulatory protein RhaS